MNKKLIRITTVPMALKHLLKGQMSFMSKNGFDVIMISSSPPNKTISPSFTLIKELKLRDTWA
jgi:hypothetical protein